MSEILWAEGIVLRSEPYGEYDRRVVILSGEHGKITAFAKGARRQTNHLMAVTDLFVSGKFKLYPGRSAYSLIDANISNYFEELRGDYEAALFGMYFLEIAERHTREDNDERSILILLYQTLRALISTVYDRRLVRAVYELKTVMLHGEFSAERYHGKVLPGTMYTLEFLQNTAPEKIYSFALKEEVLAEVEKIAASELKRFGNAVPYKSEELLASMT